MGARARRAAVRSMLLQPVTLRFGARDFPPRRIQSIGDLRATAAKSANRCFGTSASSSSALRAVQPLGLLAQFNRCAPLKTFKRPTDSEIILRCADRLRRGPRYRPAAFGFSELQPAVPVPLLFLKLDQNTLFSFLHIILGSETNSGEITLSRRLRSRIRASPRFTGTHLRAPARP